MNLREFLTCLFVKVPYSRDEVEFLLSMISDTISEGLKTDGQVRTPFGVFKLVTRKSRKIRRVDNGEEYTIPEKQVIVFKPSKKLGE